MLKSLIISVGLMLGLSASAAPMTLVDTLVLQQNAAIMNQAHTMGLNWKVGDTNNYALDMGFIQGKMIMSVKSIGAEGIWMKQDMDLGFAGKQNAEMLLDSNTGEIKKMIVGGKEQAVPKNDVEMIEVTEDRITVPAGTFDCIHARIKDKEKNEEINSWINPQEIPLSGMLKTIQPSQFGDVTISLTSFTKN